MRSSFPCAPVAAALILVAGSWSDLAAQTPPTRQIRPRNTPAEGQPVRQASAQLPLAGPPAAEEEISPELEEILQQWERNSSQIKSLTGRHKRTVYNLIFQEEKIAQGKFYLETPDRGRIDLEGIDPKKDDKSARIGKDGKPYRKVADRAERWICTGDEIIMVNDEAKTYEVVPLPPSQKGKNIINSPLPFLFGMKAEDARRRYAITLKSNSKESAFLIVKPRFPTDKQNYVEAWVLLEKTTYLPTAVKLFDASGNLETVYKFESVKINKGGLFEAVFGEKDPFHPNLKRTHKLVLAPPEDPQAPQQGLQNTRPVREASRNGSGGVRPR